mmetsp:Transcript_10351/g.16879  ORF Transcript_10351/g.16879 Transcript_10351/m.16879 type:complete len:623 (+) Transcript_10351:74-1942(+)|eukprot:CAMPEP_0184335474 /NCGR_PEP_ID=MMETSP1089-20130417/4030_1 /TAXON_ID=38269 ORGANISM="Gloeochaete wittrockiana, Strain SAG46.84" /NCGR_SAMPLE_ID=MMETSP1089 /ASSEMBLY_ACC=CAM_ASM_000445 /LENGTH=622 /DNA_ID=CAMNT_0026660137 /DNA_START=75 /DNA_END=1943 /DNA_ORIENTATION=+
MDADVDKSPSNNNVPDAEYKNFSPVPSEPMEKAGPSNETCYEDRDLMCPICFQTLKDAFITTCGHTYCFVCINEHLKSKSDCPSCGRGVSREQICPNFLLNKILQRTAKAPGVPSTSVGAMTSVLQNNWSIVEMETLVNTLMEKKKRLETDELEVELEVLLHFLQHSKKQKLDQFARLTKELNRLNADIEEVDRRKRELLTSRPPRPSSDPSLSINSRKRPREEPTSSETMDTGTAPETGKLSPSPMTSNIAETVALKKRRVQTHFQDLESCYFGSKDSNQLTLRDFQDDLVKFSRYSKLQVVATLRQNDLFSSSNIVSSIEFDRDDEFFATAGVTKKIKIFEYEHVVREPTDTHYPVKEMQARSKLSCLSWNTYIKAHIASSDYEGIVSIWDATTGQNFLEFEEHEKRAWSVDFSRTDPARLISGSDDGKVKIWSTNNKNSVGTIVSRANICCVKCNPESSYHIAFGSADHNIHYYDLRKIKEPLLVFKSHRKAVSYVKFMSRDTLVSASTDSSLKLWSVNQPECVRTFSGHSNSKNFVGLTASSDYIVCGSETNAVYFYYKALSSPILSFKFGGSNIQGEDSDEDNSSQFVSSVCWKRNSNVMLAANSLGTIKIVELQSM